MICPESIKVTHTLLNKEKCSANIQFWRTKYPEEITDATYLANLDLSENVLPCHTFSYNAVKPIFGYEEKTMKFNRTNTQFLSSRQRLKVAGKTKYDKIPNHMSEAIDNGHDIFLFAYHGIHHPYHRIKDELPIKPFGIFFKKEIEIFSCVHGSPWDTTAKNSFAEKDVEDGNLDKYYLLPEDLRTLKPIQLQNIPQLKNDFWYYFGNPTDWKTKGYGKKLFETAGEIRYFEKVLPEQIAAILWPMWHTDIALSDENLDLQAAFKSEFPEIQIVNYTYDKYENFVLSLVEASYYTQRFFLQKGKFPLNADLAKIKINK